MADSKVVDITTIDVSDLDLVKKICVFLDSGTKVKFNNLVKSNPESGCDITFLGSISDANGRGTIINGYKPRTGNIIVDIR